MSAQAFISTAVMIVFVNIRIDTLRYGISIKHAPRRTGVNRPLRRLVVEKVLPVTLKGIVIAGMISLSVSAQTVRSPGWNDKHAVSYGGQADLVVRTGDIDNLGFGWRDDFNPFCGGTTSSHSFPWSVDPDDPDGTDRIFVGSSFYGNREDGYSVTPSARDVQRTILLKYDLRKIRPGRVLLQIFVDDFQPQRFSSRFQVSLNGVRIPSIEMAINSLDQTGPVGKLLTFTILPEYFGIIRSGEVRLLIDDPRTGVGDGYAIDFVQLIINPRKYPYTGDITGVVTDSGKKTPLAGVIVSSGGTRSVVTSAEGRFQLKDIPAGLASLSFSCQGYRTTTILSDLTCGERTELSVKLDRREEDLTEIECALRKNGEFSVYGIRFAPARSDMLPDSFTVLEQILAYLKAHPDSELLIIGHTDSDGGDVFNDRLSLRRADSICAWLAGRGIERKRLTPDGRGKRQPILDNSTPEGKAANRRVELVIRAVTR